MFNESTSSSDIIRSESYLKPTHIPDKPNGRDTEINRIAKAIKPLTRRANPENIFLHGPAGIGKTTCVRHVFDRLEKETSSKAIYINCWQYNTRASLLTELLVQIGYPAPRKGKPVDELLSKIGEWLNKNRGVAVALDEFDQLDERAKVVYDLQMVNQKAGNPLGLVMVSNLHPSQIEIDPRSQSRLNCQTLQFKPYQKNHLVQILNKRAEQGCYPGTVRKEVIEEIAEYVAEHSGDCREALELLLRTGRKAEQQGCSQITLDIVESVKG